ncbi:hybrid sensor histidine kinase/response regulator [Emcibacter nanhaiensis]|uniref:histidine kinase n=1 Tax=Emcibacter nanhaiensis TaxID=1505037 RepID=A0A501PES0_9PROT|nr:PAS-domain containing protein [Emcibacter nanhaiensis]TPD58939.1 PAS domain S-box protein [Emcibacter nanhaiensis]
MIISALVYVIVLFLIAWFGDQKRADKFTHDNRHILYGLSLGIYFTSWSYYGAVGNTIRSGWEYLPIYLGPAIVLLFGFKIIRKMIDRGKANHSTSIADFLSARYGKSTSLAALVTFFALLGTLPYIALQLKSVTMSMSIVLGNAGLENLSENQTTLVIAMILGAFAILFGTRHVAVTEHNRGMVLAIAFESAFKISALILVAIFAYSLFGRGEFVAAFKAENSPFMQPVNWERFLTLTLISMGAILCLPRQFHIMVVEHQREQNLQIGRYVLFATMIIVSGMAIPIALAGLNSPAAGDNPDLFVLTLPLGNDQNLLGLIVFLGGFSAAMGMVIVSAVALSTMITNDLIISLLLTNKYLRPLSNKIIGRRHLLVRRLVILLLMLLASAYASGGRDGETLASFGILSFAAAMQFIPALIGGLYWQRGHRNGVMLGLAYGLVMWLYTLILPAYFGDSVVEAIRQSVPLLDPQAFLGLDGFDHLTHGMIWTLSGNIVLYILGSFNAEQRIVDRVQSSSFVGGSSGYSQTGPMKSQATIADLRVLIERSLGREKTEEAFAAYETINGQLLYDNNPVDADLARFAEKQVARVMGAASARIIVGSALTKGNLEIEDIATVLDETHQKLQFTQELLQSTLDNLIQGVSVVNKELELVAWNKRYLEMFEFPEGFIRPGMPIEEVLRFNAENGVTHGEEVEIFIRKRIEHLKMRKHHNYQRIRKDGRVINIEGRPMPFGNYVTSFTDVTESKRIEQALMESERSIRFYTDNVPALIAFIDRELVLKFANKAYLEWYGDGHQETLLGHHISEFLAQQDFEFRLPYIMQAMTGESVNFDLELLNHEGRAVQFQVNYVPQFQEGEVTGYFVIYQDISARFHAEQALQKTNITLEQRVIERTSELSRVNVELVKAKQLAEAATQSKTKFLAAASHDLLQPLNAARLFTHALTEDVRDHMPDALDIAGKLDSSIQSADQLIRALLDISKLDAGGIKPNISRFALHDILDDLVSDFSIIAGQKNLDIRYVPTNAFVQSDKGLLFSVLQNLISNAVRYTGSGRILVGCRKRGEEITVYVYDTGIGIPEDKIDSVFNEFERLKDVPGTEAGLGLGLAICDRIVRILGHRIQVSSTLGRGSCFAVTLPLVGEGEIKTVTRPVRPKQRFLMDRLILCVDNDKAILDALKTLLERWGAEVLLAADRTEAESFWQEDRPVPDIVLLDLQLDDGDTGPALFNQLCVRWEERPPAILVTAERQESALRSLATDLPVLSKPVAPAALRALLQNSLKG